MIRLLPNLRHLFILTLFGISAPIQAIVVIPSTGPHSERGIDPVHAPLFHHVGCFPNESGFSTSLVYLGNDTIITAWHAFRSRQSDKVWINGAYYELVPEGFRRLKNRSESGLRIDSDLVVIQLKSGPKLSEMRIAEYSPFPGEKVVMAGFGAGRGEAVIVKRNGKSVLAGFSTVSEPGDYAHGPAWGENRVQETGLLLRNNFRVGDLTGFTTLFDSNDLAMEAQASSGDSGGAVFIERGNHWQLAGIIHAVERSAINPESDSGFASFGSRCYAADLSVYRDQIAGRSAKIAVAIPEPTQALLIFAGLSVLVCRRQRAL